MIRKAGLVVVFALAFAAAGCSKRSDTEHLLIRWAEALNVHLASSYSAGNEYPHQLAEIDPMLRVALPFVDAWGQPVHYRRIDDSHYDLASPGPDGEIGNDDDVVVHNGLTQKPATVYARRPAVQGLVPQSEFLVDGAESPGGDGE